MFIIIAGNRKRLLSANVRTKYLPEGMFLNLYILVRSSSETSTCKLTLPPPTQQPTFLRPSRPTPPYGDPQ